MKNIHHNNHNKLAKSTKLLLLTVFLSLPNLTLQVAST